MPSRTFQGWIDLLLDDTVVVGKGGGPQVKLVLPLSCALLPVAKSFLSAQRFQVGSEVPEAELFFLQRDTMAKCKVVASTKIKILQIKFFTF